MPVLTVVMTTGGTVYPATADNTLHASAVGIQAWRSNSDAVYFDDAENPVAATKTGIEFAAPVAGQQMPILGLTGDSNPITLSSLKFTSASDAQKMIVFYKIL